MRSLELLPWRRPYKWMAVLRRRTRLLRRSMPLSESPSIILTRNVEPEALGVIASKYQRADEPPGTYWYDIYQDENAVAIDLQQVAYAARQASLQLRAERRKGRPQGSMLKHLANLREIFERYNAGSGRHSVLTSVEGKFKQEEGGPYLTFLKAVIAPLNEFLASLPASYGANQISAAQIMRAKVQHNRRQSPGAIIRIRPAVDALATRARSLISLDKTAPTQFLP